MLMTVFAIGSTYTAELTDVFQFQERKLICTFEEEGEDMRLSWSALPYPCVYEVETLSATTGILKNAPKYHRLMTAQTAEASYIVPRAAIPTYYRIKAQGIFQEIYSAEEAVANPNFPQPEKPVPILHYPAENPASLMPFLVWHTVPKAVCYEVEILSAVPEVEGGTTLSANYSLYSTRRNYTNGYQADLREFADRAYVYWRVRALDLHLQAIGTFSKAEKIYLDAGKATPQSPLINNFDFMDYETLPIYPVYSWIPLHDGASYEVELLDAGNKSLWKQTTQDKSSCYDEYARPYAGAYYWRVRALDAAGEAVGSWSDLEKFVVADYTSGVYAAILGDSISHGGGAVSYSPRSLEYSYATYLDFPAINLSRSGDTSHMTLERFSRDVLPFKPRNLIIATGSNSLRATSITAAEIIADLAELGRLCRLHGIKPIYLTLMPLNPANIQYAFHTPTDPAWQSKLQAVNAYIKQQKYFIDLEPYFYDRQGELSTEYSADGLHTDLKGKMLMAEIINLQKEIFDR